MLLGHSPWIPKPPHKKFELFRPPCWKNHIGRPHEEALEHMKRKRCPVCHCHLHHPSEDPDILEWRWVLCPASCPNSGPTDPGELITKWLLISATFQDNALSTCYSTSLHPCKMIPSFFVLSSGKFPYLKAQVCYWGGHLYFIQNF